MALSMTTENFLRILFAYIFGQNILVPYFGKFSHLELPDNIGRILLPTKATVHCSIYDRNHRNHCGLQSPFCNTLLVVNDAYEMNVTPRRSRSVAFTYIIILFL